MTECPICRRIDAKIEPIETRTTFIVCGRCGRFGVTFQAAQSALWPKFGDEERAKLSRYVRDRHNSGEGAVLNEDFLINLNEIRSLSFVERADRMVLFLAKKTKRFGQAVKLFVYPELSAVIEYLFDAEVISLANFLLSRKLIYELDTINGECTLSGEAYVYIDNLNTSKSDLSQAFVAMSFGPGDRYIFDQGIEPGVIDAGYKAIRLDFTEHNENITDQIITEIRRSKFLIADLTQHKGGVYYEAGFAYGLKLPVILTCCATNIANVHFDLKQYNIIDWNDSTDLRLRLARRISATIGDGPLRKTN